ncbi:hypothetical protein GI374_03700 [Paracoccus sp. S-4012]|uniref:HpcH/HpaI aldolase family protein n=1 Tax=Paracoccus sp. S-4012 TaxID=2665648 RepID=UPI0012B0A86C|nr:aldolase/citrate lyase family protein [Paracoccus sp. S-4012]MRX49562.1 hypothetical protein [Paracoccus sp. S-4012]
MADGMSLRARLAAGEAVEAFWFMIGSPALVEIAAEAGPEAVILDAQHGSWDDRSIAEAAAILAGRVPLLVRTADTSAAAVTRALDAGAVGVIAPMVETADEARAVVAAARFPPEGRRSGGGVRPLKGDFAAYLDAARAGTVVGVMAETAKAVENIDAILAVPGIDLLFVGTGDLALSLGTFPHERPEYAAALATLRAAAARAGLACGLYTGTLAEARRRRAEGWAVTVSASDLGVLAAGFAAAGPAQRDGATGSRTASSRPAARRRTSSRS